MIAGGRNPWWTIGGTGGSTITGTWTTMPGTPASAPINPLTASSSLDTEEFKAPVETLVGLWLTRFGNEWVQGWALDSDAWIRIYTRLKRLNKIEEHYLVDTQVTVFRIPE